MKSGKADLYRPPGGRTPTTSPSATPSTPGSPPTPATSPAPTPVVGAAKVVAQRYPRQVARVAADNDGRDRVEVLAVGLDGVSRRFTGASVSEKGGEPLRS